MINFDSKTYLQRTSYTCMFLYIIAMTIYVVVFIKHRIYFDKSGTTTGADTAYPSGAPEIVLGSL
jgi:hypothetical protein